ncbi:hypothetical protein FM038_25605 [Shewanella eurypsychrophilus]|uniref:DUF5667 domain-containing protein n=1 Tax=Shewanella eurypsychrophilus TaxID=2593656 RepID=A0ABX8S4S1_9GAMM|nr:MULTISPECIES: hypothetical protein [Shewanella]QFU23238.1 hypothetical protein FS418_16100 [Shewanella sp. YLB-09]QXP44831.1 hypothetical protein FM038_25605 [Shewanella eurypsychrophilus]
MKLKNIVIALACSGLLALNVAAAPTQMHQLEFEDNITKAKIITDENELIQVEVKVNNDEQSFTFTQDELADPQVIEDKLSSLPKASADKIANLLNRINKRSKLGFNLYAEKELDPQTLLKIEKMTRLMEAKGHEMEAKAREFEIHVAKMLSHAEMMEDNEHQIDARAREFQIHIEELESHAEEMEAKAMKLEAYFEEHGEEFEIVMDNLADEISDIASQYADVQIEFIQRHSDNDSQHVFVIHGDEKSDVTEHLIQSIKHSELTEKQKQAIKDALN